MWKTYTIPIRDTKRELLRYTYYMKNTYAIIIVLLLIGAGIWVAKMPKDNSPANEVGNTAGDTFQNPDVNATQLCYIWNTEAGDKAQLSMDIRGNEVTGEFNWLPAEKDKKTGIFTGTVSAADPVTMNRTVNAIWNTSAEGMTNKEELRIVFGKGIAAAGFGEMVNSDHGVYIYADPDHLSYDPSLSQTDCADEAMN